MAVRELEKECLYFQIAETTVPTVAGQSYVALPTDFVRQIDKEIGECLLRGARYPMKPMGYPDINYLINTFASPSEPYYFCITDKIKLHPIPNAIYSLSFSYYKSLGFPADGASNAWTDDASDLTFWTALEYAWRYLRNDTETSLAVAKKAANLAKMRELTGARMATGNIRSTRF